ncbi:hypothetical protein [Pedobacter steynii]
MTDPREKPEKDQKDKPEKGEKEVNKVTEPTREDGTNWEENQRIDEEGNELDPQDIK